MRRKNIISSLGEKKELSFFQKEIVNRFLRRERFQEFYFYICHKYENDPNIRKRDMMPPILYAYLSQHKIHFPFTTLCRYMNSNTRGSLLIYRNLLKLYPHLFTTFEFDKNHVVLDEIENCFSVLKEYSPDSFSGSKYLLQQCINYFNDNKDYYHSSPINIATHIIYITCRKTGYYIKESTLIKYFNIEKKKFRALTRDVNRLKKEERKRKRRGNA